jgi:hypothetical protein
MMICKNVPVCPEDEAAAFAAGGALRQPPGARPLLLFALALWLLPIILEIEVEALHLVAPLLLPGLLACFDDNDSRRNFLKDLHKAFVQLPEQAQSWCRLLDL